MSRSFWAFAVFRLGRNLSFAGAAIPVVLADHQKTYVLNIGRQKLNRLGGLWLLAFTSRFAAIRPRQLAPSLEETFEILEKLLDTHFGP